MAWFQLAAVSRVPWPRFNLLPCPTCHKKRQILVIGRFQLRRVSATHPGLSSGGHHHLYYRRRSRMGVQVKSKLFLADLGGSEKLSKSNVHAESRPKVMLQADPTFEGKRPEGDDGGSRRGWVDVDGNWIASDGGSGMAAPGAWAETERITWAECARRSSTRPPPTLTPLAHARVLRLFSPHLCQ